MLCDPQTDQIPWYLVAVLELKFERGRSLHFLPWSCFGALCC